MCAPRSLQVGPQAVFPPDTLPREVPHFLVPLQSTSPMPIGIRVLRTSSKYLDGRSVTIGINVPYADVRQFVETGRIPKRSPKFIQALSSFVNIITAVFHEYNEYNQWAQNVI